MRLAGGTAPGKRGRTGRAGIGGGRRVEQPPPEPDSAAGAFFDVDNTLMRGASIYHFARGLAARKMFGPRTWPG